MSSDVGVIPMPHPTNPPLPLPAYKLLSFDVFGTLVRYKSHILQSFSPLLSRLSSDSPYLDSTPLSKHIPGSATTGDIEFLKVFQAQEDTIKLELAESPRRFDAILQEIWARVAKQLNVETTTEEIEAFGSEANIASWPVFDGTVESLRSLSKHYKLIALSNVDKYATDITFAKTGLGEVSWAKVFTAENFGTTTEDLKHADQRKLEALLEFTKNEGVEKTEILHVAQSLGHDHAPAKKMGISSVFLTGDGPVWGKEAESRMAVQKELVGYAWRCADLREFTQCVEKCQDLSEQQQEELRDSVGKDVRG